MVHIYWIHLPYHTDLFSQGYIGVSKVPKKRLNEHFRLLKHGQHENPILMNAFKKYGIQLIQTVVLTGSESYCYEMEERIRPTDHIGWNINKGGFKPPSQKGRKWTEEERLKLKDRTPWNKGKKGVQVNWSKGLTKYTNETVRRTGEANKIHRKGKPSWNKGKKGLQVAWNKGLTIESDERVAAYVNTQRLNRSNRLS